ncbi:MAG: hypothetical protein K2J20_06250, partial [Bacilli bacterium]|nr:hypothetical protein [Bacilli bacterium]
FDIEYKKIAITKYLNTEELSETTKKEHLINIYKLFLTHSDFTLKRIIIEGLLTFNDAEIINYFLKIIYLSYNRGDGVLIHCRRDIPLVLDTIPDGDLKEKVLDYLYYIKNDPGCLLIYSNIRETQASATPGYNDFANGFIAKCNDFSAAYISHRENLKFDVLEMVKYHYKARLNWNSLIARANQLDDEHKLEFYKYLYLGNRELYFKTKSKPYPRWAKEMVEEYPESVVDFLIAMGADDVARLPMTTLAIYASHYQKQLDAGGISADDKVVNILTKNTDTHEAFNEVLSLFVFIAYYGLINNEIILYVLNSELPEIFSDLVLLAIKNVKYPYLRVSLLAKYREKKTSLSEEEAGIVLMSEQELLELEENEEDNPEAKNLKKRKYYGGLIKLLSKVPNKFKYRIAIEIAHSNIKEYIMYIKTNYPEFLELLIDNISDISLATELMVGGNLDVTEDKPRS